MQPHDRSRLESSAAAREPCPGCGALFAPFEGPTHRYIGASAGCWALVTTLGMADAARDDLIATSSVPAGPFVHEHCTHERGDALLGETLLMDAYAVQHHGDDSPQAVQSVTVHLLTLHGVLERGVAEAHVRWVMRRALRTRGIFGNLRPPPLGSALTVRHLFPGGGVPAPCTRAAYVRSVYDAWMELHRPTVERWYQGFVLAD